MRALQGLGGGGLMVVTMAAVGDDSSRRPWEIPGVGGVFGLATVIGPLIGGFLVEHFLLAVDFLHQPAAGYFRLAGDWRC